MTQLSPNRLQFAETRRNTFSITPEAGTPYEKVLTDSYWAHVSARMKPGDQIEVTAEDGAYYAELIVQDAGKLYAKVAQKLFVKLDQVEVMEGDMVAGLEVRWKGPHLRWCVLRGDDILKDRMDKASARQWMQNHAKAA